MSNPITPNRKERVIKGSFYPAGTGAVTGLRGKGIVSVTRNGVGEFTILLSRVYSRLLSFNSSIRGAAIDTVRSRIGAVSLSAKTVKLWLYTIEVTGAESPFTETATVADVAANANSQVSFELTFDEAS